MTVLKEGKPHNPRNKQFISIIATASRCISSQHDGFEGGEQNLRGHTAVLTSMKTQYYTAVSLDGYIADENHSLDWLFQFGGEDPTYNTFIKDVGAIAMGSSTYEWVLRNDLLADPDNPKPWPYSQPSWIFTSRT